MSESSEVLRKLEGKKNNLNLQLYVIIEEEQSSITITKSVDNDENVEDVGKMTKTKIRTEILGEDGRGGDDSAIVGRIRTIKV